MSSCSSRPLSRHEKRAAEAAFRDHPFDPEWGEAAQRVYVGIQSAKSHDPAITVASPHSPRRPRSRLPNVDSSHALFSIMLLNPLEQRYLIFPVRLSLADILSTIKCQFPQRMFELLRVIPVKGRRGDDAGHSR
ncbi:MAG: hypothetical protein NPIRA01_39650 [Nitrospirales bacterium]|nr:MAG: hypothetical protein NPIRA01_39650 [Nitrospirales bacterium]